MDDLQRETHEFTTREAWLEKRIHDVTSTDVAALFNCSPYKTRFELHHEKRGGYRVPFDGNEQTQWGNAFEPAIAQELARRHGWKIRPLKEYMRLPEYRLGSSFDYVITNLAEPTLLEIKNVGWRQLNVPDGWIETDFGYEAPMQIEYQTQAEMLVSGIHHCIIGACIGGNEERIIKRPLYQDVADEILAAAKAFWSDPEPQPDFRRDGPFLAKLHGFAEPGTSIPATDRMLELMREYHAFVQQATIATEEKDARKAELLTLIGDAEKVTSAEFSLSAGMVGPSHVEYDRAGFRNFRLTRKKQK